MRGKAHGEPEGAKEPDVSADLLLSEKFAPASLPDVCAPPCAGWT